MFVKIDNTNYYINPEEYIGNEKFKENKIIEEIMNRMNIKFLSNVEKQKLRIKIYNSYKEAKEKEIII